MPQVTIRIIEVKCVTKDDTSGDHVYWIRNLRCEGVLNPIYKDTTQIFQDADYETGVRTTLPMSTGQTKTFPGRSDVVFDKACPFDSYVYGHVHLMERDEPVTELVQRLIMALGALMGALGALFGSAILGGIVGSLLLGGTLAAGAFSGLGIAVGITLAASMTALLVALMLELAKGTTGDEHLGAVYVEIGPLIPVLPPATPALPQIEASGPIHFDPRTKLTASAGPGVPINTYEAGHGEYIVRLQVEIQGGRALNVVLERKDS